MPELPEVEMYKQYIDSTILNKLITDVRVKHPKILRDISADSLTSMISGSKIIGTKRIGKYLFLQSDSGEWIIFHFGMTGTVKYFRDKKDEPIHTRVLIQFKNDSFFAFAGCGVQDGSDGLYVLSFASDDFSQVLFGHGEFDDDTLLALNFVDGYLFRNVYQCLRYFLDQLLHGFSPRIWITRVH